MTEPTASPVPVDENRLIAERREKLRALRGQGIAYPNDFRREHFAADLQAEFADAGRWDAATLEALGRPFMAFGGQPLEPDLEVPRDRRHLVAPHPLDGGGQIVERLPLHLGDRPLEHLLSAGQMVG